MKKIFVILAFLVLSTPMMYAQQGFSLHKYKFKGKMRSYISYVPQKYYDTGENVPLMFALHGFGDNIDNFSNIGFHRYADTANFIVVYPEALPDPLLFANAWNSGAALGGQIPFNSTIDDVGFLNSLMDTMMTNYDIDTTRVYFTGFSFGAFMCNRMACEVRERIAAIATVSGTIGSSLDCQPGGDMPVAHFHGNSDNTISYQNNPYGKSTLNNVRFWAENSNCNPVPDTFNVPNVMNDGRSIVHYVYKDCILGEEVEFYKVNNGEHEWLNSVENDISYNFTIWTFLRKWHRGGVPAGIVNSEALEGDIMLFPNPAGGDKISLDISHLQQVPLTKCIITDYLGRNVSEELLTGGSVVEVDVSALPAGMYILRLIATDSRSKAVKFQKL